MENRNPTVIQPKGTRGVLTDLWQSLKPWGSPAVGMGGGAMRKKWTQTHRSWEGFGLWLPTAWRKKNAPGTAHGLGRPSM